MQSADLQKLKWRGLLKIFIMVRIAVFASGTGSNAVNIIRYFRSGGRAAEVVLVVCNNPYAEVIARSRELGVPVSVLTRAEINNPDVISPLMDRHGVDVIVLAGFLQMLPAFLTGRFAGKIVNIHPSLLPKYGGKGMYGRHVHEAVVRAGETETGITVHLVNDRYDDGRILFQASVPVAPADTPADVEAKVRELERIHYPRVIASTFCGTDAI